MEYIYPQDLAKLLVERWGRFQSVLNDHARHRIIYRPKGKRRPPQKVVRSQPPFPDDDKLKALLDSIYHVSFLAEEARHVAVRVIYILPKDSEGDHPNILNMHKPPVRFDKPRPLTVSELMRLAPALEITQTLLAVCPSEVVGLKGGGNDLAIWGIMDLGLDWWRAITGRSSGAVSPPNCLTFSTFSPGSITATAMGTVLFRLEGGKLLASSLAEIDDGHIGNFLKEAAESLYQDATKALSRKKYSESDDSDQHPRQSYYQTLTNIVARAAEKRHGGTFLVFPDEIEPTDQRLVDRVSLKYTLRSPSIWQILVDESVATRKYYDLLFPKEHAFLTQMKTAKAKDLKELINWEGRRTRLQEKLREVETFVASLSGVDGAVVLTKKLRVHGFGGEIIATSPTLKTVKVAQDPDGKHWKEIDVNSFGTRHRSAFRLCSSFEDCVAFVVSQDGPAKAVKRVGPDLFLWNNVNLGWLAL